MQTHLWILPWLSLIAGAATLAVAVFRLLIPKSYRASDEPEFTRRLVATVPWILLVTAGEAVEIIIGRIQSVDVIGARGLLLGSLAGLVLTAISTRIDRTLTGTSPNALISLTIFGVAVTTMSVARLWLTHGEITGLTAVALGAALAVICLGGQRENVGWINAGGVVLIGTLAAAMELGFSRAEQIDQQYWPDIPLLIASATALAALAASAINRTKVRRWTVVLAPLFALGFTWWASRVLMHETTAPKLLAAGLVSGALLWGIQRFQPAGKGAQTALATVVMLASVVLAYAYWAGYGIAVVLLAGWCILAATDVTTYRKDFGLTAPLAIGLLIAVHRALTLESDGMDSGALTDTWNLVAVLLGALLPLAWSNVLASNGGLSEGDKYTFSSLRTVVTIVATTVLMAYLLSTQSTDGLVIGAAIAVGVLVAIRRAVAPVVTNAVFLGFFVLQMMPWFALWKEPTRHVKVELLIAIAVLAAIAAVVPSKDQARKEQPTPAEA